MVSHIKCSKNSLVSLIKQDSVSFHHPLNFEHVFQVSGPSALEVSMDFNFAFHVRSGVKFRAALTRRACRSYNPRARAGARVKIAPRILAKLDV